MSFSGDLNRFVVKLGRMVPAVYVGTATRLHQSIVGTGQADPITGAPGQPVDTGNLRDSWTLAIGPAQATISTNVAYARPIEDGIGPNGPITFRSAVGGAHSVKMTLAGANAVQAAVVAELRGGVR